MQPNELVIAHALALDLAHLAGDIIKSNLTLGIAREWKADHTPVTAIDKQINQLVIDKIHSIFPSHNILAEEGSAKGQSSKYTWVCDPIDGTFPFMHGIPVSTFALSLVEEGNPILGIIYDPFQDRLFESVLGQPTMLTNSPIQTNSQAILADSTVGVIFWKDNQSFMFPLMDKLATKGVKFIDLCSIAYMDALVAAGELSATIFPGKSAHDSAAAKIIVEGAGGVFTSLHGQSQRYDSVCDGHLAAANASIHQQILSFLA